VSTNQEPLRCRTCYAVFAVHVCTAPKGAAGTPTPSRCPYCGSADVTDAKATEEQAAHAGYYGDPATDTK